MTAQVLQGMADVVTIASLTHNFLPPWELFNDFPRVQKGYKLFVYITGYIALNGRSTLYGSLSTKDGAQQSQASKTNPNGVGNGKQ